MYHVIGKKAENKNQVEDVQSNGSYFKPGDSSTQKFGNGINWFNLVNPINQTRETNMGEKLKQIYLNFKTNKNNNIKNGTTVGS